MSTRTTYDFNDITSTGWCITAGPEVARCVYRSRWQGHRSGVRVTVRGDLRTLDVRRIEEDLNAALDGENLKRGGRLLVFGYPARITDTGWEVQ